MNYLDFLLQWYNWAYMAALMLAVASFFRIGALDTAGGKLGSWLGVQRVSGRTLLRVFALAVVVVGLTVSGAIHDYWPAKQERAFLPGLVITTVMAALITRSIGRLFERHFPEITAVDWGSPDLGGREGRVVSGMVGPDFKAGRAHVMVEDGTLHTVLCKTAEGEISFGAGVILKEYDQNDGRYFVEEIGAKDVAAGEED